MLQKKRHSSEAENKSKRKKKHAVSGIIASFYALLRGIIVQIHSLVDGGVITVERWGRARMRKLHLGKVDTVELLLVIIENVAKSIHVCSSKDCARNETRGGIWS